jgi:quercetin dioxygenase-like cupin family protein
MDTDARPRPSRKLTQPLARPPESLRPDRTEVIVALGQGPKLKWGSGVTVACLVGQHVQGQNLTTGIATFETNAKSGYHQHTYGESITLLEGQITVEVEGRSYTLGPLDNLTIPRGIAHCVVNADAASPAVLHIAMATQTPNSTPIDRSYARSVMPSDADGRPGAERVTRYATAERYEAGPNTELIDHFNAALLPGFEMSGGYGLFQHAGRLPAHVHDFDESICIVQGQATCIVEGRRHVLSDCDTAFVPRGRVHYFINKAHAPMAMLWVYAGPMPERMIVDERCATIDGSPWQ